MGAAGTDAIGVEKRGESFARVGAGETDAARCSGSEGRERGFVEALKINGAAVAGGAQFAEGGDEAGGALLLQRNYFAEIGIAFQQAAPLRFDEPVNAGFGKGIAQRGGRGQGVDYVAERAEADEEEAR